MSPMNSLDTPMAMTNATLTLQGIIWTIALVILLVALAAVIIRRPKLRLFAGLFLILLIPTHMLMMPRQSVVPGVHETAMAMPMTHPCCSPNLSHSTAVVTRPLATNVVQIIRPTAPENLPRPDLLFSANKSPPVA